MDKTMELLHNVLRERVYCALEELPCRSRMELLLGTEYRPTDLLDDFDLLDTASVGAANDVIVALGAYTRLMDAINAEQRMVNADE